MPLRLTSSLQNSVSRETGTDHPLVQSADCTHERNSPLVAAPPSDHNSGRRAMDFEGRDPKARGKSLVGGDDVDMALC
jgi:hypothetical protein